MAGLNVPVCIDLHLRPKALNPKPEQVVGKLHSAEPPTELDLEWCTKPWT